jgi:hypothetical protein
MDQKNLEYARTMQTVKYYLNFNKIFICLVLGLTFGCLGRISEMFLLPFRRYSVNGIYVKYTIQSSIIIVLYLQVD